MRFQFLPAPADLAWMMLGLAERQDQAPARGSAIELPILHPTLQFLFGDDYGALPLDCSGPIVPVPRQALWGPMSQAWQGRHRDALHAFVVVLTFAGAEALARTSVRSTLGRRIAITDLRSDVSRLHERLEESADFSTRITVMLGWVRSLHLTMPRPGAVLAALDEIASGVSRGSVAELARRFGVSPRTVHKRFERAIGLGPKQAMRIARLQRLLRQLHPRPWGRCGAGDARAEFFDDAHLIREFKALTTLTPGQYLQAKQCSGDHLVGTVYLPPPTMLFPSTEQA